MPAKPGFADEPVMTASNARRMRAGFFNPLIFSLIPGKCAGRSLRTGRGLLCQLQPLVPPQVLHFMQVPFLTSVKLPQEPQASPS